MHMDDMRGAALARGSFVARRVDGRADVRAVSWTRASSGVRAVFAHLPLHFKDEVWGEFEECAVTSSGGDQGATRSRDSAATSRFRRERVLAIGDSRNDVPMLSWAGIGVAMGNASAEVRQAVGRVTALATGRRRVRDRALRR